MSFEQRCRIEHLEKQISEARAVIHEVTMTGIINNDRETVTLNRSDWSRIITALRREFK